jgi:hypothetical protein
MGGSSTHRNANPSADDGALRHVMGPRLTGQDEAADQDSRTDRVAHEPNFLPVCKGRPDGTEHANIILLRDRLRCLAP